MATPTAIMSRFAHIRSDIPFLERTGMAFTTTMLHLASSTPHPFLPVPNYWVEDIRSIPSATAHFNRLGYDIAKYTPFQHRKTYEHNYSMNPLQSEPIAYLGQTDQNPSPTQQLANMAVAFSLANQDTRTATPNPGDYPFSPPHWEDHPRGCHLGNL